MPSHTAISVESTVTGSTVYDGQSSFGSSSPQERSILLLAFSRILLLIATRDSYLQLCSLCHKLQFGAKWGDLACVVAQPMLRKFHSGPCSPTQTNLWGLGHYAGSLRIGPQHPRLALEFKPYDSRVCARCSCFYSLSQLNNRLARSNRNRMRQTLEHDGADDRQLHHRKGP